MSMEITAFIGTIVAGYLGAIIGNTFLNWPDAGTTFAIATMGSALLWAIRHQKNNNKE